jgi:hypothetical protein
MTQPFAPVLGRRRFLATLGAGALAAGCATPVAPPRPLDPARAPRVGDRWVYAYRSEWANVAPRTLDVSVISVSAQGVADRMTVQGDAAAFAERLFGSQLRIFALPLSGILVHEFSPYLEAFGPLPAGNLAVEMPPESFGTRWFGTAREVGMEQVIVPAGAFQATRFSINGWRTFIAGQMDDAADPVRLFATAWFAADVKRFVRLSFVTQAQQLNPLARDHLELASFKVA